MIITHQITYKDGILKSQKLRKPKTLTINEVKKELSEKRRGIKKWLKIYRTKRLEE